MTKNGQNGHKGWGECMPRALTEHEKCRQCNKLLEKGRAIVMSQGVKKVSVDDITKAAGVAKGTFYQHFESKEEFLYRLVWEIHEQMFIVVEQMILTQSDLKSNLREFLMSLWAMPEMVFFTQNYDDVIDIIDSVPDGELQLPQHMEEEMYRKLLTIAGIDADVVNPGVVHNFLHLRCMLDAGFMIEGAMPETIELLMDSLASYILKGELEN